MDMKPNNEGCENYETEWYWDISSCQTNNITDISHECPDASLQEQCGDGAVGTIGKQASGVESDKLSSTVSECRHHSGSLGDVTKSMNYAAIDSEETYDFYSKSYGEMNCIAGQPSFRLSEDRSTPISAQSYSDEEFESSGSEEGDNEENEDSEDNEEKGDHEDSVEDHEDGSFIECPNNGWPNNNDDVIDTPLNIISEMVAIPSKSSDSMASQDFEYNEYNGVVVNAKETSPNVIAAAASHFEEDAAQSYGMTLDFLGSAEVNQQSMDREQVVSINNSNDTDETDIQDNLSALYYGNVSLLYMLMNHMTTMTAFEVPSSRFIPTFSTDISELPTDFGDDVNLHDNIQEDDGFSCTNGDQRKTDREPGEQSLGLHEDVMKTAWYPAAINSDSESIDDAQFESELSMSVTDNAPNIPLQRSTENEQANYQEERVDISRKKSKGKNLKPVDQSRNTVGKTRPAEKEMLRRHNLTDLDGQQAGCHISDKGCSNKPVVTTRDSTLATSTLSHEEGKNIGRTQRKHHVNSLTRPQNDHHRLLPPIYPGCTSKQRTIIPTGSQHKVAANSSRPEPPDNGDTEHGRCRLPPIHRPTALDGNGNKKHSRIGLLRPPRVSMGLRAPVRLLPAVIPSQQPKLHRSHPLAVRRPFTPADRDVLESRARLLSPRSTSKRNTGNAGRPNLPHSSFRLPPVNGGVRDN